jgi:hypothetical protein
MSIAHWKSEANYAKLERKHVKKSKTAKYAAKKYHRVVRHAVKVELKRGESE